VSLADDQHDTEPSQSAQAEDGSDEGAPTDAKHGALDKSASSDLERHDQGGPPHTGDPAVDAALAAAAAVRGAEPAEQLETYVGTHRSLQDRLADSGA
jgi:hypothetical protein